MTKQSKSAIRGDIAYRIRVGVTGHRTLVDEARLAEKVGEVIDKLIPEWFSEKASKLIGPPPKMMPLRFTVVSPLAEGADRLVAREVLARPDARIELVLPFEEEEYLRGFRSQESCDEYRSIAQQARRSITLTTQPLATAFPGIDTEEASAWAYEGVGRHVVDHCDVLIALWDGEPARGRGGTAEIVDYARKRNRPLVVISTATGEITVESREYFNDAAVFGVNDFNSFPFEMQSEQAYVSNIERDLFETPEGKGISAERRSIIRKDLLPSYVRASNLAKHHQRRYLRAGFRVYTLSALAIASVALGVLLPAGALYAFGLEVIFLTIVLFTVVFTHRTRARKRWIESRFLTERLRSGIFLVAAGLDATPIVVPSYMGLAHKSDDWMVRVFDEIWGRLPLVDGDSLHDWERTRDFVRVRWIQKQTEFHAHAKLKWKSRSEWLERCGQCMFGIAVVAGFVHWLFLVAERFHWWELSVPWFEVALVFVAIVAPAVGAAVGGIRTHREYSRLNKRSENMERLLEDLNDRFDRVWNRYDFERLLREVEILMLRETQDWLMLMRFVVLEPA